jgi:hypothetical protein
VLLLGLPVGLRGAEFQDLFGLRESVTEANGTLAGSNSGATAEDGEPQHGGRHPSHSVWVTWIAPANGLATLTVKSSTFHPLLGVYQLKAGENSVRRLARVASGRELKGELGASAQFGTRAGERYEIAVDGLAEATGDFRLEWELDPAEIDLPRTLETPDDRAVRPGDTVQLTLLIDPVPGMKLKWYRNDVEIPEADQETLTLPNFQPANVGQYRVRVDVGRVRFFTAPVDVQFTTEGESQTLARDNLADALASGLVGSDGQAGGGGGGAVPPAPRSGIRQAAPAAAGVSRGYNGSQVFHTVYAGRDPDEPQHCQQAGGSTTWFSYVPPEAGMVELDTAGSDYDTVLAVYTFDAPFTGYAGLQSVECDNDSGPDGKTSRLRFQARSARTYLVVIDGVGGARGLAYLNYRLTPDAPVIDPPRWVVSPKGGPVQVGGPLNLTAEATGPGPLDWQWFRDGTALTGSTSAVFQVAAVTAAEAGSYRVRVGNAGGSLTSAPVSVTVWSPPGVRVEPGPGGEAGQVQLRFTAAGGPDFQLESAPDVQGPWTPWPEPILPVAGVVMLPVTPDAAARWYRLTFRQTLSP